MKLTKGFPSIAIAVASLALTTSGAFAERQLPTTAEEQANLSPAEVLEKLMKGNERYVAGEVSDLNIQESVKAAASGQHPEAVILSCLDSRVPVELVFDVGIGDLFVGRVAGNIENQDQLGSMEFATKLAGAKLVMVLGHEACGAVKGACDGAEMGNLTRLLSKIKPAVAAVQGFDASERNSKNAEFVAKVVEENVRQTVSDIREGSPVLAEMEKKGEIMIVGARYSLQDGSVTLLD